MGAQDSEDIFDTKKEALTLHRQAIKLIGDPLLLLQQNLEGPTDVYRDALPLLEMAVSLDPQSHVFRIDLSDVLRKLRKDDAALYHLKKALVLKPELVTTRMGVINLLIKKGRYAEGLPLAAEGTRINPRESILWYLHAHCSMVVKHYEDTLKSARMALDTMTPEEVKSSQYKTSIIKMIHQAREGIRATSLINRILPQP